VCEFRPLLRLPPAPAPAGSPEHRRPPARRSVGKTARQLHLRRGTPIRASSLESDTSWLPPLGKASPVTRAYLGLLVRPTASIELVLCSEHSTIRVDLVMER